MTCFLEEINHKEARKEFAQQDFLCPLFKRANGSLPTVCAHCCYRIQQLADAKKDLLWRQRMVYSEYQRNPSIVKEYLPDNLKEYCDALGAHGRTIEDAELECRRCRSGINKPIVGKSPVKVKV